MWVVQFYLQKMQYKGCPRNSQTRNSQTTLVTLLHSERPKLHTILAFLSAIGLNEK